MSLHPPPLSESVVSGSTYVLLANGRHVRISELAAKYPTSHSHNLLTPEGVRPVRIRMGGFHNECRALRFLDSSNKAHVYKTDAAVYIQPGLGYRPSPPNQNTVLSAFRIVKGERVYGELSRGSEVTRMFEHYTYTLTPGPIYFGDGLPITFLPFLIQ